MLPGSNIIKWTYIRSYTYYKVSNNVHILNYWIDVFRGRDIPKMVSLLTDDVKINSIIFQNYQGKDTGRSYLL